MAPGAAGGRDEPGPASAAAPWTVGASPGGERTGPSPDGEAAVRRRVDLLLAMADAFGTPIPLAELERLLPREGPQGTDELAGWLARHREYSVDPDGGVHRAGAVPDGVGREARGRAFRTAAHELFAGRLTPLTRWLRCVQVTGSCAYGTPRRGDDLDLMVIVRSGTVWLFLAAAYLELRVRGPPRFGAEPIPPCFNFVIDEASAAAELGRRRGFVVAREALTAVPVLGAAYYDRLLGQAPWMAEEIPRLYARRRATDPGPEAEAPPRVGFEIRLLNAALYPFLATYLQLQGLARNRRGGGAGGDGGDGFRTVTLPDRLLYASNRFDRLRERFDEPPPDGSGASGPHRTGPPVRGPRG